MRRCPFTSHAVSDTYIEPKKCRYRAGIEPTVCEPPCAAAMAMAAGTTSLPIATHRRRCADGYTLPPLSRARMSIRMHAGEGPRRSIGQHSDVDDDDEHEHRGSGSASGRVGSGSGTDRQTDGCARTHTHERTSSTSIRGCSTVVQLRVTLVCVAPSIRQARARARRP